MLNNLRIQNFKGWSDTGPIRMAPITIFFGTNSSGKSSIGQFLIMLKQTTDSQDRKAVFDTGGENSAVQLGSFYDMVFGHDLKKNIRFSYDWTLPLALQVENPLKIKQVHGVTSLRFEAEVGLANIKKLSPHVSLMTYSANQEASTSLEVSMKTEDKGSSYILNSRGYNLKRTTGRAWPMGSPLRFYGFPDEVTAYHQNADFVKDLNLAQEQLFNSIYYLGPLRTKTKRIYSWNGMEPDGVGADGENTIAALLACRDRKINFGPNKAKKTVEEVIAQKLKDMGLVVDFKLESISDSGRDFHLKVKTHASAPWVDLPDVGVGVSQVLPVLVQCFHAPTNGILIMEQPEIHLHPNAQAHLADAMIDIIRSREDGKERNIQLVIETHSEHFLRRLQRRMAENKIKNDEVAAYFSNTQGKKAELKTLEVDEYGNIHNWPEGFFGDDMADITAQSKAALKRRMEKVREKA